MSSSEAVFTSSSDRRLDQAETIVRNAGVAAEIAFEAVPDAEGTNVCYQRLVLRVPSDAAEKCRRLLADAGLASDILRV